MVYIVGRVRLYATSIGTCIYSALELQTEEPLVCQRVKNFISSYIRLAWLSSQSEPVLNAVHRNATLYPYLLERHQQCYMF